MIAELFSRLVEAEAAFMADPTPEHAKAILDAARALYEAGGPMWVPPWCGPAVNDDRVP